MRWTHGKDLPGESGGGGKFDGHSEQRIAKDRLLEPACKLLEIKGRVIGVGGWLKSQMLYH
jgi:hypothetical protein